MRAPRLRQDGAGTFAGDETLGRPLGITTAAILASVQAGARYGLDITQRTDFHPGTVYTTLRRLEKRGLLRGRWEAADIAERERRPRRRYYQLTADGGRALQAAKEHYRALSSGLLGTSPRGGSG